MHLLEQLGRKLGVDKAMLTVFTANVSALSFYTKLGYSRPSTTDAGIPSTPSPPPHELSDPVAPLHQITKSSPNNCHPHHHNHHRSNTQHPT
jgi:hypothetical protein